MIGIASTHHTNASDPAPSFEINAVSFDKGKSYRQLGSKKKRKSKKNQNSNP